MRLPLARAVVGVISLVAAGRSFLDGISLADSALTLVLGVLLIAIAAMLFRRRLEQWRASEAEHARAVALRARKRRGAAREARA